MLRLLPLGDRGKDAEILALRHQITVLERQLGAADTRVRFAPEDRAFLAALLAVIEDASRCVRVLGTTVRPNASWVVQAVKNPVMDLEGAGRRVRYLIRDRVGKFLAPLDEILSDAGIQAVLTGIRMPRTNAVMERWVQSCRRELLDRRLLWNERHLRHALREYERFYNRHRAHQVLAQAVPPRTVPDPITGRERIDDLNIHRRDRLGGVLHEYSHAT